MPSQLQSDLERRIASVWPLVIRKVRKFHRKLSERARGVFEMSDLLQESWSVLLEREAFFRPELSSYVIFAMMTVGQHLWSLKKRSGVVRVPRHAKGILGSGDDGQRELVYRTMRRVESLAVDPPEGASEPLEVLCQREEAELAQMTVAVLVEQLPPEVAEVVKLEHGVLGAKQLPRAEQARAIKADRIKTARLRREGAAALAAMAC
jgi:hypothetical protein